MADESYPAGLPRPLIAPYANQEMSHVQSNPVQSGPPRFELQTSVKPTIFNVTFYYSPFDFQVFEAWYKHSIVFGSKPFDIQLQVGAGDLVHECYLPSGTSPYRVSRRGQRTIVTTQLLAVEKQYNTEEEAESLIALIEMTDEDWQSDFFDLFNQFADTDLPDAWENMDYGTDFS